MSNHNEINPGVVEAQVQPQGTTPSNETNPGSVATQTEHSLDNLLKQRIGSLEKKIESLKKQNQLNSGAIGLGVIGLIGYIIATNWSAIAPAFATAGTATAAAAPVIGIVIGAMIGAAVLVGASYAIWKYRAQIKAGFEYAADKTVEGAKYVGGKIKEGAKSAADRLGDSLKGFAHSGEYPMKSPLVQGLLEQEGIKSEVNALTKVIKEDSSSVRIKKLSDSEQSKLKEILTKGTLDTKELQFVINIVSEHRDEIKNGIREYRFDQSVKRNNAKDAEERKANRPSLFSSLRKKGSTQSEAKEPLQNPFSSDLKISGEDPTNRTATVGRKPSGKQPVPVVPPKVPGSPTSGYGSRFVTPNSSGSPTQGEKPDYVIIGIEGDDRGLTDFGYCSDSSSGRGSPNSSGSSTPRKGKLSLSLEDVKGGNPQTKLRRTDPLDKELPRTYTSTACIKLQQPIAGKV